MSLNVSKRCFGLKESKCLINATPMSNTSFFRGVKGIYRYALPHVSLQKYGICFIAHLSHPFSIITDSSIFSKIRSNTSLINSGFFRRRVSLRLLFRNEEYKGRKTVFLTQWSKWTPSGQLFVLVSSWHNWGWEMAFFQRNVVRLLGRGKPRRTTRNKKLNEARLVVRERGQILCKKLCRVVPIRAQITQQPQDFPCVRRDFWPWRKRISLN